MVNIKVNNQELQVPEGTTILEACDMAGWSVPSLCYLKDINEIGACRICAVEIKGVDKLVTSCNNEVYEGIEILTNTPKVLEARKVNLSLILAQHDSNCPTCSRNQNCSLQTLSANTDIDSSLFIKDIPINKFPTDFPLIRTDSKCIKCMRCVQVCNNIQSLGIWDVAKTGSRTTVDTAFGRDIHDADCALCGQCIINCPTGALKSRDDRDKLFSWNKPMSDEKVITTVQVAPAVRAAWGEELGLTREEATPGRLAAVLRKMGFDYVFDTNFGADLTIMEEGTEFLTHLNEDHKYPLFTSCCPGWVRFLKSQYPDMVNALSSAKSPHMMQGTIIKTYLAEKEGLDPDNIYNVSIMPCVAKKAEIEIPTINDSEAEKDVDLVLTTRELIKQIKTLSIDVARLEEEEFDSPLGLTTGAAVIFGATGGVMEAALRTCYSLLTGEEAPEDAFYNVRGQEGWKEAEFDINGRTIKTAVVNGLGNARKLIRDLRKDKVNYDFVEVMACPGGCVNGGGQPIHDGESHTPDRSANLYNIDKNSNIRVSHENPEVQKVYSEFLDEPLSPKAHNLLHTDHNLWKMPYTLIFDDDVNI